VATESEKRLAQEFVGLYKVVRLQQEALAKLMLQVEALSDAVSSSPELKKSLDLAIVAVRANRTSQLLAAGLRVIDASIQKLQKQYGPWDN